MLQVSKLPVVNILNALEAVPVFWVRNSHTAGDVAHFEGDVSAVAL